MGRPTFKCSEPGCQTLVVMYRQCSLITCALELAFCKDHGGDTKAQDQMVAHIAQHSKEAT